MKRFTKIALLGAAGALLASQSARAGFVVNDLYLGFTQPSANSDLIIDLGQASTLTGSHSVVNLSSYLGGLSSFNTLFGSTANGVNMAVIGGDNVFNQYGVFATQVRSGGAGDPTVAGSSITAGHTSALMSGGASVVSGLASGIVGGLPTAGNSLVDSSKTFSAAEVTTSASSFVGKTGVNPTGTIDSSGTIYEDLYAATTASPYAYKGFFTFDYGNDSLTFTPAVAAVPEPSTYGVIAGAGLLVLSLRRQLTRKAAH